MIAAGVGVEAVLGPRVADLRGSARARASCDVERRACVEISPATTTSPVVISVSHATRPERILLEDRVEHDVGDLVGDLVRVTLGHRLGRELELARGAVVRGHARPLSRADSSAGAGACLRRWRTAEGLSLPAPFGTVRAFDMKAYQLPDGEFAVRVHRRARGDPAPRAATVARCGECGHGRERQHRRADGERDLEAAARGRGRHRRAWPRARWPRPASRPPRRSCASGCSCRSRRRSARRHALDHEVHHRREDEAGARTERRRRDDRSARGRRARRSARRTRRCCAAVADDERDARAEARREPAADRRSRPRRRPSTARGRGPPPRPTRRSRPLDRAPRRARARARTRCTCPSRLSTATTLVVHTPRIRCMRRSTSGTRARLLDDHPGDERARCATANSPSTCGLEPAPVRSLADGDEQAHEPAREQRRRPPADPLARRRVPGRAGTTRRRSRRCSSWSRPAAASTASGRRGGRGSGRRARCRARLRRRARPTSTRCRARPARRRQLVADDPEREREDRAAEALQRAGRDHHGERAW